MGMKTVRATGQGGWPRSLVFYADRVTFEAYRELRDGNPHVVDAELADYLIQLGLVEEVVANDSNQSKS